MGGVVSAVTGGGGGGSVNIPLPPPPPKLPPLPKPARQNEAGKKAREARRRQAAVSQGRQDTILTSALGLLSKASTAQKPVTGI